MPTSIGEFEVISEIGRGGMGRVYRAHDPRVGRDVAIKVLTNEGGNDLDLLARFRSEAGTAGKLTHKNIVTVYAFGEQEGMPYIVMELLSGVDLGRTIREHRSLTMLEKVRILHQIVDGLSYAHQKDVIHRDIKPGNIMVLPDGTAKILDFGIARVTGSDSTRRTQKGFVIGTIAYMAPEQFKLGMDADRLVDIFALGDVAYQLLTGEHPFGEGDPGTLISRITSMEPKPIRELAPDCPELLSTIIHQLLAKDRDLRYQNLQDVLLDLEPVLYQLRHEKADEILKEARPLFEQGQWDRALAKVKEALDQDPRHPDAVRLKVQIQQELHRKTVRGKVEALIADAERKAAQRNFAEAVQALESALQLDKREAILAKLEEVRREHEKAKRATQLLVEARAEARRGSMEAATAKVSAALEVDPNNTEASNLLNRLREEMDQRKQRLREVLELAAAYTAKQDFDQALRILDQLGEAQGEVPEIVAERAKVREAQAEFNRKRKSFDEGMAAARAALDGGNLTQARTAIDQLSSGYADIAGAADRVKELADELGRRQTSEIARVVREVEELAGIGQFEAAHVKLDAAEVHNPGNSDLRAALQKLVQAKAARERADAIAAAMENIRRLQGESAFEPALQVARAAAAEFPDHAPFRDLVAQIETELQESQRRAKIDEVAHVATALLESDPFEAGQLLQGTLAEVGPDAYLESLLTAAQRASGRRREQQSIDEILAGVRTLRAAQEGRQALEQLEKAIEQFPRRSELRLAASDLRAELDRTERLERANKLRAAIENMRGLLAAGRLEDCRAFLEGAKAEFPGESSLEQFGIELARTQRDRGAAALTAGVREALSRDDVDGAEGQLAACAQAFSGEREWLALKAEVERRRDYLNSMEMARQLAAQSRFEEAEIMLRPHSNEQDRAGQLLQAILRQKARAEEEARERERQEAEARERARQEEELRQKQAAEARERERQEQERKAAEARERHRKEKEAKAAAARERERQEAERKERQRQAAEALERERKEREAALLAENPAETFAPGGTEAAPEPVPVVEPPVLQAPLPPVQPAQPLYRRPVVIVPAALAVVLVAYLLRPGPKPPLHPSPGLLSMTYQNGAGPPPAADIDFGDVAAAFTATPGVPWLLVSPAAGDHLTKIHVESKPAGLAPQIYDGQIQVKLRDDRQATIPVHLEVQPALVKLQYEPSSLKFPDFRDGDPAPAPLQIEIPENQLALVHASWQDSKDTAWFQFEPVQRGLRVSVQTRGMTVGSHIAMLKLDLPGAVNTPVSVPVAIDIQPPITYKTVQAYIRWKGSLAPQQTLTIQGSVCSTGSLAVGELPHARIQVTKDLRQDLRVEATPVSGNAYTLSLRNTGTAPIADFILYYREEK